MNSKFPYLWLVGLVMVAGQVAGYADSTSHSGELPEQRRLDADWLFHRGELPDAEQTIVQAGFDDRQWTAVNVPHDYGLDETYSSTNDRSHGYLPVTTAWYRKHLFIPKADEGKNLELQFDGIFRDSRVWLNGEFLARHPSGYSGFNLDISKGVRYGADNVIAVHVDPRHFEGWWYEGAGIYRHVYLNVRSTLHVADWGTQVIAVVPGGQQGESNQADLSFNTTVVYEDQDAANATVVSEIIGPTGGSLGEFRAPVELSGRGAETVEQHCTVAHPQLWSPDTPRLYQLRTTILRDGRPVDSKLTTFGIRTLYFDANEGFFLNGQHVEIRGVACHQDFPAVGIAVPDSLEPWRVRQLKASGANGWRTAHDVPNEELLEACDRLGMLVIDENRHLGDCYQHHSPPGTTFTNLEDLAYMIQRDRNHPSVILWSMCNEEGIKGMEGSPEGARIFQAMMDKVHQYDRTRPITCAMDSGWLRPGFAEVEDIIGVNYNYQRYDEIHRAHPDKPMFGSETANNKTARSVYEHDAAAGLMSSYNLTDPGWQPVASRPYMAGSYTWTGFDYRGEPNPDGWPDVSNNTGLLDNCGFPKDKFFYLKSWWSDEPMVHLMPVCWNWPGKEGLNIRVIAFSNAKEVEVFLNGKSFGRQAMPQDGHLEWQIPYAPGRLLAKAYTNHKIVAKDSVETVAAPKRLELTPERQILAADGADTVVVPVAVLDKHGRLVANASNRVTFRLTGGRLLGVANGNPGDHDPDRANERNAFNGRCVALVQAGSKPGLIQLTATSPGLSPATIRFYAK
jgi:beta-galactosidase